jgi:predicted 2-oxoglutarate/Fe(II)-dependent dioxygenase YbiX
MFFGTLSEALSRQAHDAVLSRRSLFDDKDAKFFGVSVDPADRTERGLKDQAPGLRYFWDFDGAISRLYGVVRGAASYAPTALLLDRSLRVVAAADITRIGSLLDVLAEALPGERQTWAAQTAPVLTIERVFEPEFCAELIAYYTRTGGEPGGFVMRNASGATVGVIDESIKRRKEVHLEREDLRAKVHARFERSLLPMIHRSLGWRAAYLERYLVACYDGADHGFFLAHRDNTTAETVHRQFAVTLNLNDGFDGGALRFPEFGPRTYRPPLGGATVFSCGLLHEATPVERGVRYAFLPFLYDDEGVRRANAMRPPAPPDAARPAADRMR